MPAGLQIWNADGSVQLDTTMKVGRLIGVLPINSGTLNGSTIATLDIPVAPGETAYIHVHGSGNGQLSIFPATPPNSSTVRYRYNWESGYVDGTSNWHIFYGVG